MRKFLSALFIGLFAFICTHEAYAQDRDFTSKYIISKRSAKFCTQTYSYPNAFVGIQVGDSATTKGLLLSKTDTALFTNPPLGLIIYNKDSIHYQWKGSVLRWKKLGT